MFSVDNSAEKSLQEAQNLLERAASRSLNQSMTLLPEEIQQVPTRIPPFHDQEQENIQTIIPPSLHQLGDASSVLDSTITKFRSQVRDETFSEAFKAPLKQSDAKYSKEFNVKISTGTSPLKAPDAHDMLNSVSIRYLKT